MNFLILMTFPFSSFVKFERRRCSKSIDLDHIDKEVEELELEIPDARKNRKGKKIYRVLGTL